MKEPNRSPPQTPTIDPNVVKFFATMSTRLMGWDKTRAGQVIWRREPVSQGDQTNYEFSTREAIEFGGYFYVEFADDVYESGVRAGQEMLRTEIKRLLLL